MKLAKDEEPTSGKRDTSEKELQYGDKCEPPTCKVEFASIIYIWAPGYFCIYGWSL